MTSVEIKSAQGTITRVLTQKNESPTLKEAQDFVGGNVEMVPVHEPKYAGKVQVLVNEEGRMSHMQLPVNPHASITCGHEIVGNALILYGKAKWT